MANIKKINEDFRDQALKYRSLSEIKKNMNTLIQNNFFNKEELLLKIEELMYSASEYSSVENEENLGAPDVDPVITKQDFAMKMMQDEYDAKMQEEEHNSKMSENVGAAVAGNTGGMGAVVTASPSASPGQTTGGGDGFSTGVAGDSYGNGGTVGSGDIGSGWGKSKANNKAKRKKKKADKKAKKTEKKTTKAKAKATKTTDATKSMGKGINNTFDIKDFKQGPNIESFTEYSKKSKKK